MARAGLLLSLVTTGLMTVGCQTAQRAIAPLPEPNFSGPVVVDAGPVPVTPPIKTEIKPAPVRVTPSVPASWIPVAGAQKRQWTYIVIHHSATPTGGAKAFDKSHKAKGWDELGYHFVIGNGTDTPDGLIEVGSRWPMQKHGAHAKTPDNLYNDHGIGICLVGNFMDRSPSQKQLASLSKLIAYLADTYRVKQSNIVGHKMTGKQTECPGIYTNISQIRAMVAKQRSSLADADLQEQPVEQSAELMVAAPGICGGIRTEAQINDELSQTTHQ